MSNRVYLNSVKIEDVESNVTYGYILSDDYDKDFYDLSEGWVLDPSDTFKLAWEHSPHMFDVIPRSIEINGKNYDSDWISKIVSEIEDE